MEVNSSGEEVLPKARKPYTITKQREPWSEEEHNRFLEALKLYGRAWQRIEEHIGTKTAVQIRSHAQKFFTKLEKEALMKGIPLAQSSDIEIPPPRPKRKPCSPYPRKTGVQLLSPAGEPVDDKPLSTASNQLLDRESSDAQEMPVENETLQRREEASEGSCSEVLNLFLDCPSNSLSHVTQNSSGTCREFGPLMKAPKEKIALDLSSLCADLDKRLEKNDISCLEPNTKTKGKSQTRLTQVDSVEVPNQLEKDYPKEKQQDEQFPPVVSNQSGARATANYPSVNTTFPPTTENCTYSEMSSIHHPFPALTPFTQFQSNPEVYRSLHNVSSSLSSLITTTLLQNPAVHAAASLAAAASFWPPTVVDSSNESSRNIHTGEIPQRHMNPSPSIPAIAAATVAAASAWWATQGLLPLFPPIHPGFAFSAAPVTVIPVMEMTKTVEDIKITTEIRAQNPAQDGEALITGHPASKSLISSASLLSESDGSEGQMSCFTEPDHFKTNKLTPASDTGIKISGEERSKKLDRLSSSSELETDAMLRYDESKNEAEQVHLKFLPVVETNNRRSRSSGSMIESWKEVTEEGRVAFRELFNRDVLPQSFLSPPKDDTKAHTVTDLCDQPFVNEKLPRNVSMLSGNRHAPLKACRTGFKPYKRCLFEANGNIVAPSAETSSKRTRLEGEASKRS